MNLFNNQPSPLKSNLTPVLIWDWPIRIFHWSLVALVIMLWATSQSNIYYDIDLHIDCGYAVLTLLLFRLMGEWLVVTTLVLTISYAAFGRQYLMHEDYFRTLKLETRQII